jgi:glycosyltransferase involved in cell wall biosynthesis
VVRHGVDDHLFEPVSAQELSAVLTRHGLRPGYILYLGAIETRKNVGTLVEAAGELRRRGSDAELVLAGAIEGDAHSMLMHAPENGVHLLGMVHDKDKRALYSGADVYCSVSHAEGLGLTPLEALACGTPAVLSDIPAFREAFGDTGAAFVEDRDDPIELASMIGRLMDDGPSRAQILGEAPAVLARYRWHNCVTETYRAIQDARAARSS